MNPETGYYGLIQCCPNPSRLEAANVGVLLFSPEHAFLNRMLTAAVCIEYTAGSPPCALLSR